MTATTYLRDKIVDLLTGNGSPYVPPSIYLSLHTANPGVAGSHAFEVTGGGYARQPLHSIMTPADASGISVNTELINFGPATASWGTITFLGVEDALTGGNMLLPGVPATPRTINAGQPLQIPIGRLLLRLL